MTTEPKREKKTSFGGPVHVNGDAPKDAELFLLEGEGKVKIPLRDATDQQLAQSFQNMQQQQQHAQKAVVDNFNKAGEIFTQCQAIGSIVAVLAYEIDRRKRGGLSVALPGELPPKLQPA